jgi:hypothetical protein
MTTRTKVMIGAAAGGGALVVIGIILFFVLRARARDARLDPFRKHMNEYLSFKHEGDPPRFVKGKILPIDEKAKDVDSLYFDLPPHLQPQTPEEVGAVVRIKWESQVVRQYKGGGTRSQDFCLIEIRDQKTGGMVSGVIRMTGPMPQMRGGPTETDSRSLRTKVLDFLTGLKPDVPLDDQRPK